MWNAKTNTARIPRRWRFVVASFRLAFLLVLLWGLIDPGSGTLPGILQNLLGISFKTAAGMVSIVAGILGVLSCLPWIMDAVAERSSQNVPKGKDERSC
jgi:hypothetical protein